MVGFRGPLVTEDSRDVLAELKVALGAGSDAQVVRKALSLARIAARYADENGAVTIQDKDGAPLVVKLRG